jgi:OOP family OmpA-OmpF porin
MKIQIAVLAAAVSCGPGAALAQTAVQSPDKGVYIGADVGWGSGPGGGDIDSGFANQGVAGTSTSVDDNQTGWGLQLGYRFNRNWAAELGYKEFGKFDYSSTAPGGGINGSYKVNAWTVSGLYLFPISNSNFSLYGKLGLARTDTDRSVNSQSPGLTAAGASANRTGWLAGFGAQYDFSRNWYTRLGWDHYDRIGDSSTGKTDIDTVNLGVGLRF